MGEVKTVTVSRSASGKRHACFSCDGVKPELMAKTCEAAANARRDFHFKTAKQLLRENDVIFIEDLHSWKGPRGLNKSMRDAGWFRFFEILFSKRKKLGKKS